MLILLCIKLRRRLYLALVPVAFCIAFYGCAVIYHKIHANELTAIYQSSKKNESLIVINNDRALLCDFSDGSYTIVAKSANAISKNGICEIEIYMLTHYHQRHKNTLYRLIQREFIRQILLPSPQTATEDEIADAILRVAAEYDIPVLFYMPGDDALLFNDILIDIMPRTVLKRSTHPLLSLTVAKGDNRITYIGASAFEGENSDFCMEYSANSNVIIMGIHGPVYKTPYFLDRPKSGKDLSLVFYANDEVLSWHDHDDLARLSENGGTTLITNVAYYKIILKQ